MALLCRPVITPAPPLPVPIGRVGGRGRREGEGRISEAKNKKDLWG